MQETIGERVRRLRKAKDWTQVTLAYHASRAPSVVSQVETGKREPELSTIKSLAEALEVDWRYLLLGEQFPKAQAPLPLELEEQQGAPDDELIYIGTLIDTIRAVGDAARQVVSEWQQEKTRSFQEGRPLAQHRTLEMRSFHNQLSGIYLGQLESLLEGARQGITGVTVEGRNELLAANPKQWPHELKEFLHEAGSRISVLPEIIKKIEHEESISREEMATRKLYGEFSIEDHLPAEILQEPGWLEARNRALAESER